MGGAQVRELDAVVVNFDAGRYRACVGPLEKLYFEGRDPGFKALIQLSVALLQLERGLTSGPAYLLSSSQRLLEETGPDFAGLDIARVKQDAAKVERWLHGGRRGARPQVILAL